MSILCHMLVNCFRWWLYRVMINVCHALAIGVLHKLIKIDREDWCITP